LASQAWKIAFAAIFNALLVEEDTQQCIKFRGSVAQDGGSSMSKRVRADTW
jgi:hypothetical protein